MTWASRELESMPMIIRTACKVEKMMEFLVESGFHPRDLQFLTPEHEDRTQHDRRLQMWGVIQNFIRRVMKGAFPEMESYSSYFRDEEECEISYGKETLSLPALGVILMQRERDRQMETSLTANDCGVVLTTDLRERMDYAWAYAMTNEAEGRKGLVDQMLPRVDAGQRKTFKLEHAIEPSTAAAVEDNATRRAARRHQPAPSSSSNREQEKNQKQRKSTDFK